MKIYFTADTHFSHKMILKYEKRPFDTVEEMNQTLISNWNSKVATKDHIYILGDFAFGNASKITEILKKLNGKKYLVVGNHDKLNTEQKELFVWVKHYHKFKINKKKIILFHYPIYAWESKDRGSTHLHGHTHSNSHSDIEIKNKINVGTDLWEYSPVSLEMILQMVDYEK